eukprot:1616806-Alexandrium_andersonii.AAC.1
MAAPGRRAKLAIGGPRPQGRAAAGRRRAPTPEAGEEARPTTPQTAAVERHPTRSKTPQRAREGN